MILYLSRNESAHLLDQAASEKSLHIRKISGSFCLSEFIIRDMRKFASCRYFCVERLAVAETDGAFLEALQSFQTMYSARIIVIHESAGETDGFIRGLVQIGVTDIVAAVDADEDEDERLRQIAECLSDEGMLRYKPKSVPAREYDDETDGEKESLAQSIILKEMEDEQYRFDCLNIRIGMIGATRRVGTTTIALGLANFIKNHGGTASYAALNINRHLESIAETYGFDAEEDYYTYDAIDFYECMKPKHDYNFMIFDFGDLYHGEVRREAVKGFKECEIHLLCGTSGNRYEVMEFAEALKAVRSVKPQILTCAPVPEVVELFRTVITKEPAAIRPVRDMMDFKTNGAVFKQIIQPYIVETSKRL
jgi:hypothetical protein